VHITDPAEFHQILDRVRQIQPRRIFSSHLPAASGTALEEFLRVLEQVPTAERYVPPDADQFAEMIEAMAKMQRAGEQVPATGRPDDTGQSRVAEDAVVPSPRRVDSDAPAGQTSTT
jgi:hypothetical protein